MRGAPPELQTWCPSTTGKAVVTHTRISLLLGWRRQSPPWECYLYSLLSHWILGSPFYPGLQCILSWFLPSFLTAPSVFPSGLYVNLSEPAHRHVIFPLPAFQVIKRDRLICIQPTGFFRDPLCWRERAYFSHSFRLRKESSKFSHVPLKGGKSLICPGLSFSLQGKIGSS